MWRYKIININISQPVFLCQVMTSDFAFTIAFEKRVCGIAPAGLPNGISECPLVNSYLQTTHMACEVVHWAIALLNRDSEFLSIQPRSQPLYVVKGGINPAVGLALETSLVTLVISTFPVRGDSLPSYFFSQTPIVGLYCVNPSMPTDTLERCQLAAIIYLWSWK